MRIRQIKPSFWTDAAMASLTDAERLFYIATWMLADDGGYFEWNVPEIAMQLYGYHPRKTRERWVNERAEKLAGLGRLHLHDCGHAYVTHLLEHQRFGGKRTESVTSAHARDCPRSSANVRHGRERERVEERVGESTGGDDLMNINDPALRARVAAKAAQK